MLSLFVFSSAWILRKSLPSPDADGGSRSIQDSQVPSLVSQVDRSPSSPPGHNWEMNYQEAAIYLQVSAAGLVPGCRDGMGVRVGHVQKAAVVCLPVPAPD